MALVAETGLRRNLLEREISACDQRVRLGQPAVGHVLVEGLTGGLAEAAGQVKGAVLDDTPQLLQGKRAFQSARRCSHKATSGCRVAGRCSCVVSSASCRVSSSNLQHCGTNHALTDRQYTKSVHRTRTITAQHPEAMTFLANKWKPYSLRRPSCFLVGC